jgi:NAD(P)H-dependent flavin oxidoreductase YrpB (nitropropane dioxygenase family)
MQAMVSIQNQVMDYPGLGESFDASRTFMPAGQGAGLIREIKPAAEVVRDIIREAEAVIEQRFVEPSRERQTS